jgi:hypothetical protein
LTDVYENGRDDCDRGNDFSFRRAEREQAGLDVHDEADDRFVITLESLIKLIAQVGQMWTSSEVEKRRKLLNIFLSNSTLMDGKLWRAWHSPIR